MRGDFWEEIGLIVAEMKYGRGLGTKGESTMPVPVKCIEGKTYCITEPL
jgi:hypothetical protein